MWFKGFSISLILLAGAIFLTSPRPLAVIADATEQATMAATALPGASGKPVEFLVTPEKDTIVRNVLVSENAQLTLTEIKIPTEPVIFESGVKELHVSIQMFIPDHDVKTEVQVRNNTGEVKLKPQGYIGFLTIPDLKLANVDLVLDPESGSFDDGPYQATVIVDNQPVALLNWQIGGFSGATPAATTAAVAPMVIKTGHWKGSIKTDPSSSITFDVVTSGTKSSIQNIVGAVPAANIVGFTSKEPNLTVDAHFSFSGTLDLVLFSIDISGQFLSSTTAEGHLTIKNQVYDWSAVAESSSSTETPTTQATVASTMVATAAPTIVITESATQVSTAETATGSVIAGTIVGEADGQPVPNLDVILYEGQASDGTMDYFPPDDRIKMRSKTDAKGQFSFQNVPAGLYGLVFSTSLPNLGTCVLNVGYFNYFSVEDGQTQTLNFKFPSTDSFQSVQPGYLNMSNKNFYGCKSV